MGGAGNRSSGAAEMGGSVRETIRAGRHRGPTTDLAPGHVQANLVVLPRSLAFDFLLFAVRNPRPCPLIEVVEQGFEAARSAPGSDLRTNLPGYRLFVNGELADRGPDASAWWREDLVSFLLGCSFSFDAALVSAGVPVRHIEVGVNVPMFITNRPCEPAGPFAGPLVVSCRPVPRHQMELASVITGSFTHAHGGPVHVGDPSELGIADLTRPDFGDPVPMGDDEVPMFWACGVTPQVALASARPELAITHEPGHMFITDQREGDGSRAA